MISSLLSFYTFERNEHECVESDWIDDEEFTCGESGYQYTECTVCHELMQSRTYTKRHAYTEEVVVAVTCTENGTTRRHCVNCGKEQFLTDYAKGHKVGNVAIVKYPSNTENGIKSTADFGLRPCDQRVYIQAA